MTPIRKNGWTARTATTAHAEAQKPASLKGCCRCFFELLLGTGCNQICVKPLPEPKGAFHWAKHEVQRDLGETCQEPLLQKPVPLPEALQANTVKLNNEGIFAERRARPQQQQWTRTRDSRPLWHLRLGQRSAQRQPASISNPSSSHWKLFEAH